jgi:hypothetical protein
MATIANPPPQTEVEARAWLKRLTRQEAGIELFLAWRGDPSRAETFDRLAADRFGVWNAERDLVLTRLESTPEALEEDRNRLIDRLFDLETLILSVRGGSLPAIQAKAKVLLYRLKEQHEEEAPAMEDIRRFVEITASAEQKVI